MTASKTAVLFVTALLLITGASLGAATPEESFRKHFPQTLGDRK